jgi:hypothetical protein
VPISGKEHLDRFEVDVGHEQRVASGSIRITEMSVRECFGHDRNPL